MALFPPVPGGALFSQVTVGTSVSGITAAGTAKLICAQSTTAPLPSLDQGYFPAQTGVGKVVRLYARGLVSFVSAASVQTLVLGFAFATSDTTTIGNTLFATGTITPATSQAVTNAVFELEGHMVCQSVGTAGAFQCYGLCTIANTTATLGTLAGTMTVGMGSSAAVAMSTEQVNYLQVFATWGGANSSASNTIRADHFMVYAEN